MGSKSSLKKIKISLILNIIIVLFTLIASIMMFTGIKFTDEVILESSKLGMFKFFTVDSNLFMGIVSFFFLIYERKVLKKEISDIPKIMYLLKLMGTVSVMLTFAVVFLYLGPIAEGGIISMLYNSNLFFHLLIPIISLITYVFFEKTDKLSFKNTFLALIPMILYALFYLVNVLVHIEEGKVSPLYDWYWFVQNGIWTSIIVVPVIFLLTYIISFILWKLNKCKI